MIPARSDDAALRIVPAALPETETRVPERPRLFLVDEEYVEGERRLSRLARARQIAQVAALILYAAVVAVGIAFHEPWADEAQAWLLARDQSFWHLLLHSVRYESSPGLWHALLWALARAHVSYVGMHWISGACAVAGVYVLLRSSPFPLILKILLPFGFWLAYQDAGDARSYVLYAILAFPAAAILRGLSQEEEPAGQTRLIGLALLLGLMANLSVHGFIASLGFAIVALAILRRNSRAGSPVRIAIPALLLCSFLLFAVVTVFPPSDIDLVAGRNVQHAAEKFWSAFGSQYGCQEAKRQLGADKVADVRTGELAPISPFVYHRTPRQTLWRKAALSLSLLTFPVSNFRYLALVLVVLAIAQAIAIGPDHGGTGWVGLAPWALLIAGFLCISIAPRHCGMLWESLLAALWLTWPEFPLAGARLWLHRVTLAVLVLVAADQIGWTARALWGDIHGPYSGDVAMAKFIASQGSGKRIAGFGYHSVGVEPYFTHPIYFNQPTAYWIWSRNVRIDQEAQQTIARHPDIIILGGFDWSERNSTITDDWLRPDPTELDRVPLNDTFQILPYAEAHGYRETHRFCGHAFMRQGYSETECQVALQPVLTEASPAPESARASRPDSR